MAMNQAVLKAAFLAPATVPLSPSSPCPSTSLTSSAPPSSSSSPLSPASLSDPFSSSVAQAFSFTVGDRITVGSLSTDIRNSITIGSSPDLLANAYIVFDDEEIDYSIKPEFGSEARAGMSPLAAPMTMPVLAKALIMAGSET